MNFTGTYIFEFQSVNDPICLRKLWGIQEIRWWKLQRGPCTCAIPSCKLHSHLHVPCITYRWWIGGEIIFCSMWLECYARIYVEGVCECDLIWCEVLISVQERKVEWLFLLHICCFKVMYFYGCLVKFVTK